MSLSAECIEPVSPPGGVSEPESQAAACPSEQAEQGYGRLTLARTLHTDVNTVYILLYRYTPRKPFTPPLLPSLCQDGISLPLQQFPAACVLQQTHREQLRHRQEQEGDDQEDGRGQRQ